MKYIFTNGHILDGTKDMKVLDGHSVLVEDDKITGIVKGNTVPDGFKEINLEGKYLMPGLINMHVHLAGNGKPQKKQRDNEKTVKMLMGTALSRAVTYKVVKDFAKTELMSGVTTIRTVGGLADFDTRVRDDIRNGKADGPRILAANEGISVPGGHMAGSVAVAANNIDEALVQVDIAKSQNVDLIKLMITGGVLDAKAKGVPGELKMKPEMVKAVCDKAHALGYKVAAHVESPEGVRVALENGVDSIEHGAKPDDEIIHLFKENNAFLCTTLSPALPYALFPDLRKRHQQPNPLQVLPLRSQHNSQLPLLNYPDFSFSHGVTFVWISGQPYLSPYTYLQYRHPLFPENLPHQNQESETVPSFVPSHKNLLYSQVSKKQLSFYSFPSIAFCTKNNIFLKRPRLFFILTYFVNHTNIIREERKIS